MLIDARALGVKWLQFEKIEKVWEFVQLPLGTELHSNGNHSELARAFLLKHGLCFGMEELPPSLLNAFDIKYLNYTWQLGTESRLAKWRVTGKRWKYLAYPRSACRSVKAQGLPTFVASSIVETRWITSS